LNQGDAFVLEDIDVIYTWFGKDCFALENFEANRAAYVIAKRKKCNVVTDVVDNNNKILGIASWERQHQGCTSCARLQNCESYVNKDDEMILRHQRIPSIQKLFVQHISVFIHLSGLVKNRIFLKEIRLWF